MNILNQLETAFVQNTHFFLLIIRRTDIKYKTTKQVSEGPVFALHALTETRKFVQRYAVFFIKLATGICV